MAAAKSSAPSVRTLVLQIASVPGNGRPVDEVDAIVAKYVEQGYTLVSTHFVEYASTHVTIAYILAKQS